MMGQEVLDPDHVEGDIERLPGLGLLPILTTIGGEKRTRQVSFTLHATSSALHATPSTLYATHSPPHHLPFTGYEIHMGRTLPVSGAPEQPLCLLSDGTSDGYCADERCAGTYIHGLLDNAEVIDRLLAPYADKLSTGAAAFDYGQFKNEQYDRLADHVRHHLDMERLYQIMTTAQ